MLSALLLVALVAITVMGLRIRHYEMRPYFYDADQPLVERSYRLLAEEEHQPLSQVRRNTFAKAIQFGDRRCIEIGPTVGVLGGAAIFCYDRSGRLIENYQVGQ
jgi:hypothetical protein